MTDNKRRFPRHHRVESLSLTVVSAAHLLEQGERIYCESVDISPAGMQVILDRFVARDSRVEIWFVVLDERRTYHLQGKISWVDTREEAGRERIHAGIKVLPTDESDFLHWLALFEE